MRVLHVINNLGGGGAEKLIEQVVPKMNRANIRTDVLLLTDRANVFGASLERQGVSVYVIPLKNPYSPRNVKHIASFILSRNYDIVHAHLFPALYWTAFASFLLWHSKPIFVVTEHNTHNRRRTKRYMRFIEKLVYSKYHGVISISKKTQENLMTWLGIEKDDRFVVIYNGIDIDYFTEAKPYVKEEIDTGLDSDTYLLCMAGSFTAQKDQKTVIRSLVHLPPQVHLLLVGDGPLRQECEEYAIELGVENRVHFLGFRHDVARIMKSSDIIVLSSRWEGFGLVAVEGMAAGKPVIATNVQGLSEVVEGAGILFESGDDKKLAKEIVALLADKERYQQVANMCSSRATCFSISDMATRYLEFYSRLMQHQ